MERVRASEGCWVYLEGVGVLRGFIYRKKLWVYRKGVWCVSTHLCHYFAGRNHGKYFIHNHSFDAVGKAYDGTSRVSGETKYHTLSTVGGCD